MLVVESQNRHCQETSVVSEMAAEYVILHNYGHLQWTNLAGNRTRGILFASYQKPWGRNQQGLFGNFFQFLQISKCLAPPWSTVRKDIWLGMLTIGRWSNLPPLCEVFHILISSGLMWSPCHPPARRTERTPAPRPVPSTRQQTKQSGSSSSAATPSQIIHGFGISS